MARTKLVTKENLVEMQKLCRDLTLFKGYHLVKDLPPLISDSPDYHLPLVRNELNDDFIKTGRYFGDGWFEVRGYWEAHNV